jgi:hypothetical protein
MARCAQEKAQKNVSFNSANAFPNSSSTEPPPARDVDPLSESCSAPFRVSRKQLPEIAIIGGTRPLMAVSYR